MSNTSSIREQLTFKAGLQIFLTLAAIIFTVLYTLDGFQQINEKADAANAAIQKYKTIYGSGLTIPEIKTVATKEKNYSELLEIINSNSQQDITQAITKTSEKPYLEWITAEVAQSDKAKKILSDEKGKINSIIPTLSPINQNINENTVSLREYITYFEEKILQQFSIQSLSPLGITGIKYPNEKTENTENTTEKSSKNPIGVFQVDLAFNNTTVTNISRLLDFVHSTGNPDPYLTNSGTTDIPKIMSNPLITVESLAITEAIDTKFPNKELSGKITLNFYIRGSSNTDKLYLIDSFNKQKAELSKKISDRINACNTTKCPEIKELQLVQKKFTEFNNSFNYMLGNQGNNSVESMYLLSQQLQSLKAIAEEFEDIK